MLHLRERNIYMTESFLLFTNSSILLVFLKYHLKWVICKPRHWNLGIGIGIAIGTEVGTDATNAIISTSTKHISTKPSRVVIQDEGNPPTKSLTTWSRDKSKMLYLHFHKAYGPQMTCDRSNFVQPFIRHKVHKLSRMVTRMRRPHPTLHHVTSITSSRDSCLVGSLHLFHFQLKLSPKSRQISNDYDNTENMQLV